MKKIIFIILLGGTMVLQLAGCNNSKKKELDDIHSFEAIVMECNQKFMLVRPNESEDEYKSGDKFRIEYVADFNSCNIGDKVKITYEGMINESYPAQISTTGIEIIKDIDFYISKNEKKDCLKYKDYLTFNDRKYYLASNIDEFYVIDKEKMILKSYITNFNHTLDNPSIDKIIAKLDKENVLKDGGTTIYKSKTKDVTIVICKTLDGNNDVFIGDYKMNFESESMCK